MAGMIITALSHGQGLVILVASPLICQGKACFFHLKHFISQVGHCRLVCATDVLFAWLICPGTSSGAQTEFCAASGLLAGDVFSTISTLGTVGSCLCDPADFLSAVCRGRPAGKKKATCVA
jgi:hypothetical protein